MGDLRVLSPSFPWAFPVLDLSTGKSPGKRRWKEQPLYISNILENLDERFPGKVEMRSESSLHAVHRSTASGT
jgi:hypothetical protein